MSKLDFDSFTSDIRSYMDSDNTDSITFMTEYLTKSFGISVEIKEFNDSLYEIIHKSK